MRIVHPASSLSQQVHQFVFGIETSLVSTVGILSGIAFGGFSQSQLLLIGIIFIFVQAFLIGAERFVSEQTKSEFILEGKRLSASSAIPCGLFMFVGYFFAGLIPLVPYLIAPLAEALSLSIMCALLSLVLIGLWNAAISKTRPFESIMKNVLLGIAVVIVGSVVGLIAK